MPKVSKTTLKYTRMDNIKFLLKNLRSFDAKRFWRFFLLIPVNVLLPIITGLVTKLMIDAISIGVSEAEMVMIIFGVTFLIGAIKWIEPILYQSNNAMSNNLSIKYKISLFNKLMTLDYVTLENPDVRKQHLSAKLFVSSTSRYSSQYFFYTFVDILTRVIGSISYLFIIITINPILLLIYSIGGIVLMLVNNYLNLAERKLRDSVIDLDFKNKYFFRTATDFPAGKDIRIFSFGSLFHKLMRRHCLQFEKKSVSISNKRFIAHTLANLTSLVTEGAALLFLLSNQSLSVSDIVFYMGITSGFWIWVVNMSGMWYYFKRQSETVTYYREFLDIENTNQIGTVKDIDTENMEITFCDVEYTYPGNTEPTIKNVNFSVKRGERIAIVGRNGAGKTTCIKLLVGLYQPTSGKILLNGVDISTISKDKYIDMISVLFQDNLILPLSIASNITLQEEKDIDYAKLDRVIEESGFKEKLDTLDNKSSTPLVKQINESAIDLSGGERQKLLLARALYKEAPILVLDEPTAALDPLAENSMYLKYSQFSKGLISFFISHRLSSTRFCDRILYFEDGKIIEVGSHEQLLAKNGAYAHMFNIQSYYYKHANITMEEVENG